MGRRGRSPKRGSGRRSDWGRPRVGASTGAARPGVERSDLRLCVFALDLPPHQELSAAAFAPSAKPRPAAVKGHHAAGYWDAAAGASAPAARSA